jgi:hypothetical protein
MNAHTAPQWFTPRRATLVGLLAVCILGADLPLNTQVQEQINLHERAVR